MNLTKNDLASFATAVLNTYDLSKLKIDKERALSFLSDQILSDFEELNLAETMSARHQYYKIGEASDYAESFIELGESKKIICGIRHLGGNPDLPFINCLPNFEMTSIEEAKKIARVVQSRFEKFSPRYLSFYSSKKMEIDLIGSIYLVSNSKSMSEARDWKLNETISLERIVDHSFYDWYKEGYEEFHQEQPHLRSKVTVNDLDTMTDSLDQGLLFYAKIGQERVGLIAAIKSEFLGHPGIYFNEIFLSKKFRGKGLAKSLQRKFILDHARPEDIVWGTIDDQNKYSYQTAVSNGREAIRYECFLKLS